MARPHGRTTPGKAGGLLGEPLEGADKTVSRLKAAEISSFPFRGKVGMGVGLHCGHPHAITKTHPHPNPPLEGEGTKQKRPYRTVKPFLVPGRAGDLPYLITAFPDLLSQQQDRQQHMLHRSPPKAHH